MNRKLLATALLAALTAAVHIFIGTPEIEAPLLQSSLPQELSLLLYVCWHLVSVILFFSAIVFFVAARTEFHIKYQYSAKLISLLWLSFGFLFIVIAVWYSGAPMLLKLPQWVLFLPIGALGLWGSRDASFNKMLKSGMA